MRKRRFRKRRIQYHLSKKPWQSIEVFGDDTYVNFPAGLIHLLATIDAPATEEIRGLLVSLRHQMRWPQAYMAAVLGVPLRTLQTWEGGERTPSGAARKLIWTIYHLLNDTGVIRTHRDLASWGEYRINLVEDAEKLKEHLREMATLGASAEQDSLNGEW